MREVCVDSVGTQLRDMLENPDPVDEDIFINSGEGDVLGVVISEKAYNFFLEKVEEEEDRIDRETAEEFHRTKE
ncbi:hypothetical protein CWC05_10110 [Pseudoalteromonas ruthenica]|uniref:Uncharacterized protein n=1 Tax=Pseudoalteromonas ruthenica TaxID=151081 RepID=A0A5S3Z3H8_9GAMM|nr:hypothetical protein [Pseudoalteromonas ruthenica]TMO42598.1 hypothetical protein CWC24_17710 [Pseudoalteromonas ruthenica]TMO48451.1 hypothetical protein CWC23_17580 [Pseudoalteromonas ruthenica]TMP86824.1 hypothetical protein CWC05_10110 [Pseudoalteromonas ruthenica]